MVKYLGEQLSGIVSSVNGWFQSYGYHDVKPPIIYGDVSRPNTMTVFWSSTAQSIPRQSMKEVLIELVTTLNWSFVGINQPRHERCYQIVLAIKYEVKDLEKASIKIDAAIKAQWNAKFAERVNYKEEAAELKSIITRGLPFGWEKALSTCTPKGPAGATKNLFQQNIDTFVEVLPGFLGGSAGLASYNMILLKMYDDCQDTSEESNVRFGVKEHGMGAICNGFGLRILGQIPYFVTFFVFTDYMRAAIKALGSAIDDCNNIGILCGHIPDLERR
ncbi:transketolase, chloroplastic-like [Durio zibethinus]|uniref:Transketolase, chloroplastic-like n=1 Tax=Durio zibethinus TaxID=66656 RepID=A0A6P5ZNV9_DURZI|nr:transketolase, chloroplastic-like [Durio zibethinus]